jgi:hypothetical protein
VFLSGLAFALSPSCSLVPGWTQKGAPRSYTAGDLFEYMDGNSEGYFLYGFDNMHGVTCAKDDVSILIDISDFLDPESAFGMFTSDRDWRQPLLPIGTGGQISERRGMFAKGQYFVEITVNEEGDHAAILKQWVAALDKVVQGSIKLPEALSWFPVENQQSLRLVPESVLGISMLERGYVGQYPAGKAFVVTEESPAAAGALMKKLQAHFGETSAAQVADEAFLATDHYLGRLCVFRKGRYIGGYANVAEGQDPVALAKALAARVP